MEMEDKIIELMSALCADCASDNDSKDTFMALAVTLYHYTGTAMFNRVLTDHNLKRHTSLIYTAISPCVNDRQRKDIFLTIAEKYPSCIVELINNNNLDIQEEALALSSLHISRDVVNIHKLRFSMLAKVVFNVTLRSNFSYALNALRHHWPSVSIALLTIIIYIAPIVFFDSIPTSIKDRLQLLSSIHELAIGGIIALLLALIRHYRSKNTEI